MRGLQTKLAYFVVLCAAITMSSCHSKNQISQNRMNAPISAVSQKSSNHPNHSSTRSSTHKSGHYGGGKNVAKLHPRKTSPKADANLLNADALPKANYKIAGIGKAQDPSAIYNWNWARDFGGTVDAVTISF